MAAAGSVEAARHFSTRCNLCAQGECRGQQPPLAKMASVGGTPGQAVQCVCIPRLHCCCTHQPQAALSRSGWDRAGEGGGGRGGGSGAPRLPRLLSKPNAQPLVRSLSQPAAAGEQRCGAAVTHRRWMLCAEPAVVVGAGRQRGRPGRQHLRHRGAAQPGGRPGARCCGGRPRGRRIIRGRHPHRLVGPARWRVLQWVAITQADELESGGPGGGI